MNRGFTLVEVLVSVMIFSIVMTIALGALLSMSESNRRAEALKSVINNLNFALDSMSRTIRTGGNYHCGITGIDDLVTPEPQNCDGLLGTPLSASYLALRTADGSRVSYCLSGGAIVRQVIPATDTTSGLSSNCGAAGVSFPLTSSEVNISTLEFIVTGACSKSGAGGCVPDSKQPKVTMLLSGTVTISTSQTQLLNLQTSITQRIYDQ